MTKKHFTDEESNILSEHVSSIRRELFKETVPDDQRAELLFELEKRLREHPIFQKHLKTIYSNREERIQKRKEKLKKMVGFVNKTSNSPHLGEKMKLNKTQKFIIWVSLALFVFTWLNSGAFSSFLAHWFVLFVATTWSVYLCVEPKKYILFVYILFSLLYLLRITEGPLLF